MEQGRKLLIRSALLIVIAICIVIVIESGDKVMRGIAAAAAIIVEIVRDAVLASGLKRHEHG